MVVFGRDFELFKRAESGDSRAALAKVNEQRLCSNFPK
jgi:hypothetical protein